MTNPLPYRPHNHHACVSSAMEEAQALCQSSGTRLTRLRAQVLELIWQSHRPLGAYDILAVLNEQGRKAAPPTVYRTLDFLQSMGLVHRIASLNAFIGCTQPSHSHSGYFLICEHCQNVLELPADGIRQAIHREAAEQAFSVRESTVEIAGTCPACRQTQPSKSP
ncbi:MAG: Fur family transcriptional regulator [Oleiphilaceae bacterium]|nr:Fur family transcriptional regulator [Oleiphilaceae bacterium]